MPVRPLEHRDAGFQFDRALRVVPEVGQAEFGDADLRGSELERFVDSRPFEGTDFSIGVPV